MAKTIIRNNNARKATVSFNRTPKLVKVSISDPEELAYAREIADAEKWVCLENFSLGKAKAMDWQMLQYWLYFTEGLATQFVAESELEKEELQDTIERAQDAIIRTAQIYNNSAFKIMRMGPDDREYVREAFLLCDAFKPNFSDKAIEEIAIHVSNVIRG